VRCIKSSLKRLDISKLVDPMPLANIFTFGRMIEITPSTFLTG